MYTGCIILIAVTTSQPNINRFTLLNFPLEFTLLIRLLWWFYCKTYKLMQYTDTFIHRVHGARDKRQLFQPQFDLMRRLFTPNKCSCFRCVYYCSIKISLNGFTSLLGQLLRQFERSNFVEIPFLSIPCLCSI